MQRCKAAYGLCKGGKVDAIRVRSAESSTEYGEAAKAVQRCKAEQSSGVKVERWGQSEYRVQRTEYGGWAEPARGS